MSRPVCASVLAARKSPRIPRVITPAEVRRMRSAADEGETYRSIARRFGVSVATVSSAIAGPQVAAPVDTASSPDATEGAAP